MFNVGLFHTECFSQSYVELCFLFVAVTCSSPPNGINTVQLSSDLTYNVGENVSYSCKEGYEYNGQMVTSCLTNGNWSSHPSNCTSKINDFVLVHAQQLIGCFQTNKNFGMRNISK